MNAMQDTGFMNGYTISWGIYLLAAIGIFTVVWRCSRSWPTWLRQGLRFIVACIVLVPAQVDTANEALAPAFIIAIFDGVLGNSEGAATALSSLALAIILGLLFYGVWLAGKRFYKKKRAVKSPSSEAGNPSDSRESIESREPEEAPIIAA